MLLLCYEQQVVPQVLVLVSARACLSRSVGKR
jgi:hypothetical protein